MKTVSRGRATVLSLGTDDLTSPPRVEAAFREILSLAPRRNIVVDMEGVTRVTSMGVSALSAGAEMARRQRGRMALASVRPEVLSLIRRAVGVRGLGEGAGGERRPDEGAGESRGPGERAGEPRGPGERAGGTRPMEVAEDVESALRGLTALDEGDEGDEGDDEGNGEGDGGGELREDEQEGDGAGPYGSGKSP